MCDRNYVGIPDCGIIRTLTISRLPFLLTPPKYTRIVKPSVGVPQIIVLPAPSPIDRNPPPPTILGNQPMMDPGGVTWGRPTPPPVREYLREPPKISRRPRLHQLREYLREPTLCLLRVHGREMRKGIKREEIGKSFMKKLRKKKNCRSLEKDRR